jgi:hypothetical protein
MPSFVITNVGNAALYDPTTGAFVAGFSKLDSIQITIDSKMTEVYGGTSAYPLINILADRKPVIDLKGPEIPLGAYYRLLGATNTAADTSNPVQIPIVGALYTIPADGTVTLNPAVSTVNTNVDVVDEVDGTVFEKVASAPTAGQFSISGSTLTFNTQDAGKTIRVYYDYDSTTGGNIGVSASAIPGIFTFKATAKYFQNVSDPAKTAYNISFVAHSCQLVGTLTPNMQRQQAASQSIQLNILDPGNGKNPVEIRTDAKYF